jgi:hypothetical protein
LRFVGKEFRAWRPVLGLAAGRGTGLGLGRGIGLDLELAQLHDGGLGLVGGLVLELAPDARGALDGGPFVKGLGLRVRGAL